MENYGVVLLGERESWVLVVVASDRCPSKSTEGRNERWEDAMGRKQVSSIRLSRTVNVYCCSGASWGAAGASSC